MSGQKDFFIKKQKYESLTLAGYQNKILKRLFRHQVSIFFLTADNSEKGAPDGVSRDAGLGLFYLRDSGLVTKFCGMRDSN